MAGSLPVQPAHVFERRRAALASQLGDTSALVVAGGVRARNYPANIFPFRADSHFLYLTGAALPDAVLMTRGDTAELFMIPKADDDALWHGETPGSEQIARATGVSRVRPLSELQRAIADAGGPERVATVPSADPITRHRQCGWLGRSWPAERRAENRHPRRGGSRPRRRAHRAPDCATTTAPWR